MTPITTSFCTNSFCSFTAPPIIPKDINDSVTAIVGQDFEIACAALGIPKPVITWSYEGFPVDTQGLKYQVNLLGVLLIRKIIEVDSGLYTCTAVNTAGSDSHNFALFVQGTVKPLANDFSFLPQHAFHSYSMQHQKAFANPFYIQMV